LFAEKVVNAEGCARCKINCDGFAQSHGKTAMGNAHASVDAKRRVAERCDAFPGNYETWLSLRSRK
jgi:hypothetical protein